MITRRTTMVAAAALALVAGAASAQNAPGVTDTSIKVGNIMPYSGPASAYGQIGETMGKCLEMLNAEEGGINGRKIEWISVDDGYQPPRTVEQARRLVEQEQVAFLTTTLGTPPNSAIHRYMNQRKVPQLFVATGATKWDDPQNFPWTMGWQPNYQTEGRIYAKYVLENIPDAKVGMLIQNDDYGRDYLKGFKDGLGDRTDLIVMEQYYEVADPTVDSQVISLANSGANVFFNITTPKFAAQAIKKAHEIGWKPVHFLNNVSISVGSVLQPAGLEASKDIISVGYQMDPTDPAWADHPEMVAWRAFMDKYHPGGDQTSTLTAYGYSQCMTLKVTLEQAGDDLSRENIMKQAANLKNVRIPLLLPGILVNTSPTDFAPIQSLQLMRFDGATWQRFGDIISAEAGGS